MYKLTEAEKRVLRLIYYPNDRIAFRLGLQLNTIKSHKKIIREKLGADSDRQIVILALKEGIISLDEIKTERD